MKSKRGELEGGVAIATFVLLLALFIIVYVILLPADEREELLKYDTGVIPGSNVSQSELDKISLLAVSPGRVYKLDEDTVEKEFGDIALYSKNSEEIIKLADRLYVSDSLFKDGSQTMYFRLDDVDMAQSLDLYFFINDGSGNLKVELNGVKIFDDEINSQDIPINLPTSYLQKDNTLKISTNSFIFKNEFELKTIQLKYVSKLENKNVRRNFVLTASEKKGIKTAELTYYLNCINIEEGLLEIKMNGRSINKERVLCDAKETKIDISEEDLEEGSNSIEFSIDKGNYKLEDVQINLDVSEKLEAEYTFFIEDDDYDYVDNIDYTTCEDECKDDYTKGTTDYNECIDDCKSDYTKYDVILRFKFKNAVDRKQSQIAVNDIKFNMDVTKETFVKDISEYIQRGANYIKIIPKNDFDIESLNIYLEEN
ncbi:MAG: hypothetical protein PHE43_00825 [Candidatus Nanoarchaeia archaeon]|nr:hypothetical protein [Candidatus Nanoarchaeia archaeon]